MDDYISRQAVVNVICDTHIGGKDGVANALPNTYGADIREIIEQIDSLPSLDAVEVVRCKDCRHRYLDKKYGFMCNLDTGDPFEEGRSAENDDWFCADGERKDGEQHESVDCVRYRIL